MLNRPSIVFPFVLLLGFGISANAQSKQSKVKKPKADPHVVVKVDDEIRVLRKAELKPLKSQIGRDYKQAVKDYAAAVKEARKNKTKHTDPKPKKAKLKVLNGNCKDAAAAQKFVEALEAKAAKKRAARDKKGAKAKKKVK